MLTRHIQPRFWTSLGLSLLFSFIIPTIVLGTLWGLLIVVAQIPGTHHFGNLSLQIFTEFLAAFGTGHPVDGILVISSVIAIVGGLFDTYASRSYH